MLFFAAPTTQSRPQPTSSRPKPVEPQRDSYPSYPQTKKALAAQRVTSSTSQNVLPTPPSSSPQIPQSRISPVQTPVSNLPSFSVSTKNIPSASPSNLFPTKPSSHAPQSVQPKSFTQSGSLLSPVATSLPSFSQTYQRTPVAPSTTKPMFQVTGGGLPQLSSSFLDTNFPQLSTPRKVPTVDSFSSVTTTPPRVPDFSVTSTNPVLPPASSFLKSSLTSTAQNLRGSTLPKAVSSYSIEGLASRVSGDTSAQKTRTNLPAKVHYKQQTSYSPAAPVPAASMGVFQQSRNDPCSSYEESFLSFTGLVDQSKSSLQGAGLPGMPMRQADPYQQQATFQDPNFQVGPVLVLLLCCLRRGKL